MPTFKTTIEVEVPVKYRIEPGQKGCRDSMGVPEEPSYPAHVADVEIDIPDRYTTEEIKKQAQEEAEEHFNEQKDNDGR